MHKWKIAHKELTSFQASIVNIFCYYLLNTAWFAQAKMKPHHESMSNLHFLSLPTQSHAYCTSKHFIKSNYTANTPKINLDCIAVLLNSI